MRGCRCWSDAKTAATLTVVFALFTSTVQIFVQFAAWYGTMETNPMFQNILASTVPFQDAYIALGSGDCFMVFVCFILLFEIELQCGCLLIKLIWVVWLPLYILAESAINITYFSTAFNQSVFVPSTAISYLIVPLAYWVLKDSILTYGYFCTMSYLCPCGCGTQPVSDAITPVAITPQPQVGYSNARGVYGGVVNRYNIQII